MLLASSMIPELPVGVQLECELMVRSTREHGLKDPQQLLDLTATLIRQVFILERTVMESLKRIAHLEVELALATTGHKAGAVEQKHYEMTAQIMDELGIDMP